MKIKEKVLKEPVTEEEHKTFMDLFKDEFGHPTEIPSEFERMIAFSRYRIQNTLAEVGKVIDDLDKIQDKGSDWDIGHHEALQKLKQKLGIKWHGK